jgi:hypothetical protein
VNEAVKEGDEWEDTDMGTKTIFAGYENVTVPAGTYPHCYNTVTTVEPVFMDSLYVWRDRGSMTSEEFDDWASYANDVTVRWFASGVGLVKEQLNSSDHTRELLEVVKTGIGKVDADTTEIE